VEELVALEGLVQRQDVEDDLLGAAHEPRAAFVVCDTMLL